MSTTRRHTATLVATLLAGTLALGACGDKVTTDDAAPLPEEQVEPAQPAGGGGISESDLSRQAREPSWIMSLAEIRLIYPTAGTEVPPATLRMPTYAEKLTENNLHTGFPRVTKAPARNITDGQPNRAE